MDSDNGKLTERGVVSGTRICVGTGKYSFKYTYQNDAPYPSKVPRLIDSVLMDDVIVSMVLLLEFW